jgi:hypothetical protein
MIASKRRAGNPMSKHNEKRNFSNLFDLTTRLAALLEQANTCVPEFPADRKWNLPQLHGHPSNREEFFKTTNFGRMTNELE